MIDLRRGYNLMQEILEQHGQGEARYCITVQVWNYRTGTEPSVNFTASANLAGVVVMAASLPSIDEVLDGFESRLRSHLRAAGPAPSAVPVDDLRVELPGRDGGPVEAAAIAASEADRARALGDTAAAGQHEDRPF